MSGHTAGPWFVTGSMTKYVEARIGGGMLQEVASCGPTEADGGYGDTQIANANLIAAAPDLLDALQLFVKAMRSPPTGPNMTHEFDIDKAERAIAKALAGESK